MADTEDNYTAYEGEFQRIRNQLELEPGPLWQNLKDRMAARPRGGLFGNSRAATGQSIHSEVSPIKVENKRGSNAGSEKSPRTSGLRKGKGLKGAQMMNQLEK